ncbi:MAG: AhpC/TSA family protein [Saprospiraceae bacterium]|nr:AhpC/TSA family protein [Saprospiraceae bacterium]
MKKDRGGPANAADPLVACQIKLKYMEKLIFLILMGFAINGCSDFSSQSDNFILRGISPGLADGTVLHLIDAETGLLLDSAIVVDHQFEIAGQIDDPPMKVYIICKRLQDSRLTWIDPGIMTIQVDSTLMDALTTGSVTDQVSFELYRKIRDSESEVEAMEIVQNFIRTKPQSIVSASLLAGYSIIWGKSFSKTLYDGLSDEMKETKYGAQIASYMELNNPPNLGEKYVNIIMKDPVGQDRELSELNGKVVLLEFWASSCKPCRDQNPHLREIYNRNHSKGFEIFSVSLDEDIDQWTNAIKTDKLPWIHVSDLQGSKNEAALIYGVSSIPDNFLIDQNGLVVGRDLRGDALSTKLDELLTN